MLLLQDVRYAIRMLVKNPMFTAAAVTTLALGIGLNTAIFSMVNAALFKPVRFRDADRLVTLHHRPVDDQDAHPFSYPDYAEYRDHSGVFEELATCHQIRVSINATEATTLQTGRLVTGNYFQMLGVNTPHGRLLGPSDDLTPGAHPVAVISDGFWRRSFNSNPAVIGQTILVNGQAFTIVGVAPEGFREVGPAGVPDVWLPMMMQPQLMPGPDYLVSRGIGWLHLVIGRLKSDVSMSQAQSRLETFVAHLAETDPARFEKEYAFLARLNGLALPPEGRRIGAIVSALVMATVALVLLIACANVANLLLARSTVRTKEIGIRLALGAGRVRLVRQLLTESLVVSLLGGVIGMLVASWVVDLVPAMIPPLPVGGALSIDLGIDWRVFAFTAGLSILVGVIFGLAPALHATRLPMLAALKEGIGTSGGGIRQSRLQGALVVGQVAVSMTLLIGAGLFVRSLLEAKSFDAGFDHEKVVAVTLDLNLHNYDEPNGKAFYRQALERVRSLSEVEAAGLDAFIPLGGTTLSCGYWVEEQPDEFRTTYSSIAGPGVFETLGIPLLGGRDFTDQDASGAPLVAIVNKALADEAWPGENPVGKRISKDGPNGPWREVVGVLKTVKFSSIEDPQRPLIYVPFAENYMAGMTLVARSTRGPSILLPRMRSIIRDLDVNVAPVDMRRYTDVIADQLVPAKVAAALFSLLGALALMLASVGLYGVVSFAVSRRSHEIGVRVALGAQRGDVLRLILRQGLSLTGIGIGIGIVVSLAGSFALADLLYGVGAGDPVSFIFVALFLVAVAALACYIPARRATKVDPVVALRYE